MAIVALEYTHVRLHVAGIQKSEERFQKIKEVTLKRERENKCIGTYL